MISSAPTVGIDLRRVHIVGLCLGLCLDWSHCRSEKWLKVSFDVHLITSLTAALSVVRNYQS